MELDSSIDTSQQVQKSAAAHMADDITIILLVIIAVVGITLHAPSDLQAYAQVWNIGAGMGMLENDEYILPRNQSGDVAVKGQLFPWLVALAISLTGIYEEYVFRAPTILASLASGIMVYFLARRWYGRSIGVWSGCLWAAAIHMRKLMAIATTDMLVSLWILVSIFCVDRLLFHPGRSSRRWAWAVGFWAAMILAALSKGWGIINFAVVGGFVAAGAALMPGFKVLRRTEGFFAKSLFLLRLLLRRWWRAIKAVKLLWGLLAFAAVFIPLWMAMLSKGGKEFQEVVYFEVWQRFSGTGASPPAASRVPPVLIMFYYLLPTSIFAVGAMLLIKPRKWFARRGPILLPLVWLLSVLVPFSMAHGFRPDYLLPCYGAVAMMAAWAIARMVQLGPSGGAVVGVLRHVFAGPAVLMGACLTVIPWVYLFHDKMPAFVTKVFPMPVIFPPQTRGMFWILIAIGIVVLLWSVRFSLRWKIKPVIALTILGMLGVMSLYSNGIGDQAKGDGERIYNFATAAGNIMGSDKFCTNYTQKLGIELFIGRFGKPVKTIKEIRNSNAKWLITSDWAMRRTSPDLTISDIGRMHLQIGPIDTDRNHGKLYLIRLD